MNIEVSTQPLSWGALDITLFGVNKDWHGAPIEPAVTFGFAVDHQYLWFIASHARPALLHPDARPSAFHAELWKYDVAEFFLLDPTSGHYLEFNLAPNGAWWSAEFSAPRQRVSEQDVPLEGVTTFADLSPDGSWLTAAALPLNILRERYHFGKDTRMNATFIIESPHQRFLTAASLGEGEPDFHQPEKFPLITFFQNHG